jgi:hypothetical protein
MKKILSTLLSVILLLTTASPLSERKFSKIQQNQHASVHQIIMVDKDEDGNFHGGLCTATAVGPHTLLTAEHCNDAKTDTVYVDADRNKIKAGTAVGYTIVSRELDHQDHMLLDLDARQVSFTHFIPFKTGVRTPEQGEYVYWWGNPGGLRDMYREGLVEGSVPTSEIGDSDVDATGQVYLVQAAVIGGDSGAAVFSMKDGSIIGIVTYGIDDGQMMGSFPIQFTQPQIDNSRK